MLSKYDISECIRIDDTVINSTGTGTLGRVGFIESLPKHRIVPDSHVTTIRTSEIIEPYYVYLVLKSLQSYLEKKGEGSTNQKELKPITLQNLLIPIPPLDEQKCICKQIRHCKTLIKNIEDSLS